MIEMTLGLLTFILAIVFVAFMAPKRTEPPPKAPSPGADENKKDSDSAKNAQDE